MADRDDILIDDIEATFRSAYRRYRRSDPVEQDEMFDTLESAAKEWVVAQRKLVEKDERATQDHLNQMRSVKRDIDDAANAQEFTIALARLVAFLVAL
ncbi:hypothetical protein ACFL7E_07960 [Thermodesulfobacteriota bacterium]